MSKDEIKKTLGKIQTSIYFDSIVTFHCDTKEKAKILFRFLKRFKCRWSSNEKLTYTNWDHHKEKTIYYYIHGSIMYDTIDCEDVCNYIKL